MTAGNTLSCHWCGVSLANANQIVFLNGNLPVCGLCLLRAGGQKLESTPDIPTYFCICGDSTK